jgi:hypothetical protein
MLFQKSGPIKEIVITIIIIITVIIIIIENMK